GGQQFLGHPGRDAAIRAEREQQSGTGGDAGMGLAGRTGGAKGERCARAVGKAVTAVVLGVWLWRSLRAGWGLWRGCRCARTLLCAAGRWADHAGLLRG